MPNAVRQPVEQIDELWYYWTEDWSRKIGPFDTKDAAEKAWIHYWYVEDHG